MSGTMSATASSHEASVSADQYNAINMIVNKLGRLRSTCL